MPAHDAGPRVVTGRRRLALRVAVALAGLAGVALLVFLIGQHGAELRRAMHAVGWTMVPIIALHALQLLLSGGAWRAVTDTATRASWTAYTWMRWIREGVSGLLPVAQVGGEVAGARLLVLSGVPVANAAASVTVDVTVEAITLVVFTLCGIAFAVITGLGEGLVGASLAGLAALAPIPVFLLLLRRQRAVRLVERVTDWLSRQLPGVPTAQLRAVHAAIVSSYGLPGAFRRGCLLHMASWFLGVFEIWLMAWAIDAPVSLGQALIIETIGQAIRSAAFFVPGALGVQEGGMLLIAVQIGLPPETGLALSLLKRVREIALGVPALAAWYTLEGCRWPGARARRPAS